MLVKYFRDYCSGSDTGFVLATDADTDGFDNEIPDQPWVTEPNRVLLGFHDPRDPNKKGFASLTREKVMELAVFLAECASHMEDE